MKQIQTNDSNDIQCLSILNHHGISYKGQLDRPPCYDAQQTHMYKFKNNKRHLSDDLLFIKSLSDYIKKHYQNDRLTVEDIASHFHISIRKLQNKMKLLTNFPPYAFVIAYRLDQASKCLAGNVINFV